MKTLSFFILFIPFYLFSQTDPGGIGSRDGTSSLKLWCSNEIGITLGINGVSTWEDQSGNGLDFNQSNIAFRPALINNALNGYRVLRFGSAITPNAFLSAAISPLFTTKNGF